MTALIDADKVRIVYHAATRAVEMGMSPTDVTMTIACPDAISEPTRESKYYGMGRAFHDYDDYTAVVEKGEKLTVITFLWRYAEGWEKSYADDHHSDRKRRPNPFAAA